MKAGDGKNMRKRNKDRAPTSSHVRRGRHHAWKFVCLDRVNDLLRQIEKFSPPERGYFYSRLMRIPGVARDLQELDRFWRSHPLTPSGKKAGAPKRIMIAGNIDQEAAEDHPALVGREKRPPTEDERTAEELRLMSLDPGAWITPPIEAGGRKK